MKKMHVQSLRLFVATALMTASALFAGAQTRERFHDVSSFSAIDVGDAFEVTVAKGAYGVKLTVDAVLSDYVGVYVKSNTLYLSYDSKAVPKEVRKMYRGRNAPKPILRAVIYSPVLEGVYLDDDATLTGADAFEGGSFSMILSGKANVKSLAIHSNSAKLQLKKNAQAVMTLDSEREIELITDNSAQIRLNAGARDMNVSASGSSNIDLSCDLVSALVVNAEGSTQFSAGVNAAKVYVNSTGSSKLAFAGSASSLIVKGARSTGIDALGLPVVEAEVEMNSGSISLDSEQTLTVDLSGGAAVYYNGNPEMRITKILKSTLAPYGTK